MFNRVLIRSYKGQRGVTSWPMQLLCAEGGMISVETEQSCLVVKPSKTAGG